ncbi:MAG: PIN domain-containing protein [Candidatus Diapherotrites archaeon]|uniref:PIN domain-containing protein n=1 Tax=Candidatus Iainarchaeum sp. TaxID=3101447 RepID=A0A8T3YMP7_9ARCH|nr:PIN domain-containing protein [Candidatus Diapherotrites archaeon]
MNDEFLVDSNILVYAFDASESGKYTTAAAFLENAVKLRTGFLSVQNLSEFHTAVTTKIEKKLNKEESLATVRGFAESFGIIKYDEKTIFEAVNLELLYKIPYWDALIAATMIENNIKVIYTENEKGFRRIPWLKVINPLK